MKPKKENKYIRANAKLVITIVPIVLLLILIFFMLTNNEILALSKDKLVLESKNCAQAISAWSEQILNELEIYKKLIEQMGLDSEETLKMLKSTYGSHEEYPMGLYLGDDKGTYIDSSGWVPGDDFVVTEREWYIEGSKHEKLAFGEPYVDAMTGDICVSVTARLKNQKTESVLAADVYLDYASQLLKEITEGNIEIALFVTDKSKVTLADSNNLAGVASDKDGEEPLLYQNINELLEREKVGLSEVRGEEGLHYVYISKIENMDWYFVTCMNRKEVLKDLIKFKIIMTIVAIIAALALVAVTYKVAREMSEFKKKAKADPLTRLFNRDGFKEMMLSALEENPKQGLLLIIDMDNFKLINDQLGHPVGDQVLKEFSDLLREYFNRSGDIVGRIGGDEFAVFVGRPMTDSETKKMLEKFIILVHSAFDSKYPKQELSCSIGGSFVTEGSRYDTLYASADQELYEVKRAGKDGFRCKADCRGK